MMERKSDRVLSISLSIVVHLAIVGALVWGWFRYRQPPPTPQSLAIEGTVVHNQPQTPAPPSPAPPQVAAPPPAPQPQPPDVQQQAEQQAKEAQRKAQEQAAAEQTRIAAEKAAADKAAADKAAAERAAADRAAAEKAAADKAAADKAAADKAAADKAAADKAVADRRAEEARKQEVAREAKAEADRKEELSRREADLKAQMAAEEHQNAVQSGPARAEYLSLITARINHAWIRPPSARPGVRCTVHITQVPGGVVTHVSVTGCNGDESVRQSVETAAYRASPLPAPSDPALFDPNIDVTFAPDE